MSRLDGRPLETPYIMGRKQFLIVLARILRQTVTLCKVAALSATDS